MNDKRQIIDAAVKKIDINTKKNRSAKRKKASVERRNDR
jgi:hypothetical protein